MAFDLISSVIGIGGKILDRVIPDPTERDKAKLALLEMQQKGELAQLTANTELGKAAAGIVQAESESQNWLASSWRPITMLTFVALITARWFGFAAPDLSEAEYLKLWDIVQLGLGGYVIGRSIEKIAPQIVEAVKK